jgi:hypothetical protein
MFSSQSAVTLPTEITVFKRNVQLPFFIIVLTLQFSHQFHIHCNILQQTKEIY